MHPNPSRPAGQLIEAAPTKPRRSRKQRLISLGYALGLILVFLLSLLLLPADVGLGKLLWGALGACTTPGV